MLLQCERCRIEFERPVSRRFCGYKCANESRRKYSRDPRPCAHCGTAFDPPYGRWSQKFCNIECATKAIGAAKRKSRVTVSCEQCKGSFEKRITSPQKFCCRRCVTDAAKCRPRLHVLADIKRVRKGRPARHGSRFHEGPRHGTSPARWEMLLGGWRASSAIEPKRKPD
jgi:hypothetical protein